MLVMTQQKLCFLYFMSYHGCTRAVLQYLISIKASSVHSLNPLKICCIRSDVQVRSSRQTDVAVFKHTETQCSNVSLALYVM